MDVRITCTYVRQSQVVGVIAFTRTCLSYFVVHDVPCWRCVYEQVSAVVVIVLYAGVSSLSLLLTDGMGCTSRGDSRLLRTHVHSILAVCENKT